MHFFSAQQCCFYENNKCNFLSTTILLHNCLFCLICLQMKGTSSSCYIDAFIKIVGKSEMESSAKNYYSVQGIPSEACSPEPIVINPLLRSESHEGNCCINACCPLRFISSYNTYIQPITVMK